MALATSKWNLQLKQQSCIALRWLMSHENQNQKMPWLAHHASGVTSGLGEAK